MFYQINLWAVLIATVAGYLIGWAWYSKILWQKPWMEARGDDGSSWNEEGKKEMPRIMFYGFLNTFAMAFVLAVVLFLASADTLVESLQIALLMAFGFAVTIKFNELLYTAAPPHWGRRAQTLFFIDSGYLIVFYLVSATILWWLS